MTLPIIDGKEVVPIRLIPFVTQRTFSQPGIAGILAHRLNVGCLDKDPDCDDDHVFYAYRLNDEGVATRMLATEWRFIDRSISRVAPALRAEEEKLGLKGAKESEWIDETLRILPEGSFLWREDFERLWEEHNDYYTPHPGEALDSRKFNYDAYIPAIYKAVVWEGFSLRVDIKPMQPSSPMKTFTQKEVAVILKTDSDSVLKRMMGGLGVLLQPSIVIKTPVLMHRTVFVGGSPDDFGRGAEQIVVKEELIGIFNIGGIRSLQWDELGLAQITFGEWPPDREKGVHGNSSGVFLHQGENTYMVKDPLKICKEELVVTKADLLRYGKETIGVTFELSHNELTPEHRCISPVSPNHSHGKPEIKPPRLKYYSPHGLAEYWRKELNVKMMFDSTVDHFIEVGMLKIVLLYETKGGARWWSDEEPETTAKVKQHYGALPPYTVYVRLEEAERFEKENFAIAETKLIPELVLNSDATTSLCTPTAVQQESKKPSAQAGQQFNFQNGVRKAKNVAPITQIIEAFYAAPYKPHGKTNFYAYVKDQLANKESRIGTVLFSELVEKVVTAERGKGVYMVRPKEGAKSGTDEDYRYSDSALSPLLSRKKGKQATVK